jgi:hypothetical protein
MLCHLQTWSILLSLKAKVVCEMVPAASPAPTEHITTTVVATNRI